MRRPLMHAKPEWVRAFIALLLFCGIAVSVGLSAAPQLHDWLHKADRSASHECAATLLSSGSWEHTVCDEALSDPQRAPRLRTFEPGAVQHIVCALEFARLEHAPPARS